jgi:ATP-dependent Clp protease ATP-binding subunit ClpB
LEQAKIRLAKAQREGNFAEASELLYGEIPRLEKQLPKGDEGNTVLQHLATLLF